MADRDSFRIRPDEGELSEGVDGPSVDSPCLAPPPPTIQLHLGGLLGKCAGWYWYWYG